MISLANRWGQGNKSAKENSACGAILSKILLSEIILDSLERKYFVSLRWAQIHVVCAHFTLLNPVTSSQVKTHECILIFQFSVQLLMVAQWDHTHTLTHSRHGKQHTS